MRIINRLSVTAIVTLIAISTMLGSAAAWEKRGYYEQRFHVQQSHVRVIYQTIVVRKTVYISNWNYYTYGHGYTQMQHHVAWCSNRYKSYKAHSNSYFGYDGYHHVCISPYI